VSVFAGVGELGALVVPEAESAGIPVELVDVERWVGMLPAAARELLALGPIEREEGDEDFRPGDWSCRLCQVIAFVDGRTPNAACDFLDLWHGAHDCDAEHYGTVIYLRCLLVYSIAGWAP
jgi:hypothetical protein